MKIFLTIAAIMALVIGNFIVYGATFQEGTTAASVTVNTFVDITITDRAPSGINFGSLDPGTNNNAELAQNGLGAVNFSVQATTNIDPVNVKLRGTDFTFGGNTLGIGNVTADDDGIPDDSDTGSAAQITSLLTTDQTLTTLSPDTDVEIFFWIDVPTSQAAATYSSTFTFRGD